MSPSSFPRSSPLLGARFPPRGPVGMVPPLRRYYQALRLLPAHPASLGSPRSAVPRGGGVQISQVPGESLPACRDLRPRWSGDAQVGRAAPWCLPCFQARRLPQERLFRGSITRPTGSLSTLRSYGRPHPRKTRFRLVT